MTNWIEQFLRKELAARKALNMKCDICDGLGDYPVIDDRGRTRFCIPCPECFGSGLKDEEAIAEEKATLAAERAASIQRAKYEAAMAEKRAQAGKAP